jgi:hypothetical protein
MRILYADESGNTGTDLDNVQQPIFVLGALSIKDTKWHETNNYFNEKKIEIYNNFKNIEIHTNEIFSPPHKSIFHIKNWKDNFQILDNIVDLIMELDIDFKFVAIDKKKLKANLHLSNNGKIDPYIFSFSMLYNFTAQELELANEKGIIFLDEIIEIPEVLNKIYPSLSANNTTIIEQALFLKSKDTNFIQIADVFSFYICQYLNIDREYKKYNEFKRNHCINNYKKLITKTTKSIILDFE